VDVLLYLPSQKGGKRLWADFPGMAKAGARGSALWAMLAGGLGTWPALRLLQPAAPRFLRACCATC